MFGSDKKPAQSGAEIMLRSLGLGEIIDVAKSMAESGVFEKIVLFAETAEEIKKQLTRVEEKLDALVQSKAGEPATMGEAGTDGLRWPPIKSGAGAGNGHDGEPGNLLSSMPEPTGHS